MLLYPVQAFIIISTINNKPNSHKDNGNNNTQVQSFVLLPYVIHTLLTNNIIIISR